MFVSFHRLYKLLSLKQKKSITLFLFLLLFSTILEGLSIALIFPLIKIILDKNYLLELNEKISFLDLTRFDNSEVIIYTLIFIIIIYMIKSAYLIFFSWWKSSFIFKLNNNISERLFNKYIYSSYSYFFNKNTSEFLRNIYNEARFINQLIDAFLKILVEVFSVIVILSVLLSIKFQMTLYSLIFFSFFAIIFNFIFSKKIKRWSFEKQSYVSSIFKNIQQSFSSIKEIIIRGNQNFFSKEFSNILSNLNLRTKILMFISEIPKNVIETMAVFAICFVIFKSYQSTTNFTELIPTIGLFGAAALRIMPAFNRIIASKQNLDGCYPSIKLVFEELKDEKIIKEKYNLRQAANITFENELSFENISFKYPSASKKVINNLSFKIKKNECICFIGESGSGKTTLIDLISGLINPSNGIIKLDGKKVSLNNENWQKNIGYVTQNSYLIDDTIKKNILFGLEDDFRVDEKKLKQAIKDSQLDQIINLHPEGINFNVGENGIKLSGGQKQRISIARTLYHQPKILILDEITSSLDNDTSKELLNCLNGLLGKITIIYISHNENVIKNANIVYKLEKDENNATILVKK